MSEPRSAKYTGHCLCGSVTFASDEEPVWCVNCHCESCRRATASASTTCIGFPAAFVSFTGEHISTYQSSTDVTRSFCGKCGTQLSYVSTRWPGDVLVYAANLDDPERVRPDFHVHTEERISWHHIGDDLPQLEGGCTPDMIARGGGG